MDRKKKVLIVNDELQYGGSDFVAVRLQQNLNPEQFECVYCVRHDHKGPYEAKLEKTGVRIIHQPDSELGYIKSYLFFKRLFKEEHFDIVHSHLLFYSALVLMAAKNSGIKKRVAHSHFSQSLILTDSKIKHVIEKIYHIVMRELIIVFSTDIIGCSEQAGIFLAGRRGFNKKGIVLNNGIDTAEYQFNRKKRNSKRLELDVEDKTVIGHIGQMYYVKNHSFLIDVFYDYQKQNSNSVLFLISDGPDRRKLENKVEALGIQDKVKFLGFRNDIPELLMSMDCFVFPSIHEGFPLTLVEAQAAKLPCVVSSEITDTVKMSDAISFLPIEEENTNLWCNEIDHLLMIDRESVSNSEVIKNYDIKNITKILERIYTK